MSRAYLVANAHLDPGWLWDLSDGFAAAAATFRAAAGLCEEFDYIFCHNEALLYEMLEENEPALFSRITELIARGKWRVMGGWYLQPDCNMISGESFFRQIETGRAYFWDKFGVRPEIAVNVDPFGHSGGLPQILAKNGYRGYLICRPNPPTGTLPAEFVWKGADGTRIPVCRLEDGYGSFWGKLIEKAEARQAQRGEEDFLLLWGVGNHGGGPSRRDLEDVRAYRGSDMTPVHATPEMYFSEVLSKRSLPEISGELNPVFPGCYTSVHALKAAHRLLESELYKTEKLCSAAALAGLSAYPGERLDEAQRDLLLCQFHDLLPGSCSERTAQEAGRVLAHGLEILRRCRLKAMFALANDGAPAAPGSYPVFVFNPEPRRVLRTVEAEVCLAEQNWSGSWRETDVFSGGRKLCSQTVRQTPNIEVDWMKRVVFEAELEPFSLTRFDLFERELPQKPASPALLQGDFLFRNEFYSARISRETGLLDRMERDGTSYLAGPVRVGVYRDNEDSWGFFPSAGDCAYRERIGEFEPLPEDESGRFSGLRGPLRQLRVLEDGDVLTETESVFGFGASRARMNYRFYRHHSYFDLSLHIFFAERDRMLKLEIPAGFHGEFCGQTACARQRFPEDGTERVAQKWAYVSDGERMLGVVNDGTYGLSEEGGVLSLSLVRGAAFGAMPIEAYPMTRQDGFAARMDQGNNTFRFRFFFGRREEVEPVLDTEALAFAEAPEWLNYFPDAGPARGRPAGVLLEDPRLVLCAFAKRGDGWLIRLHNCHAETVCSGLSVAGVRAELWFAPFEVKTLRFADGKWTEE